MLKAAMRIHMEEQSKDMRSTAGEEKKNKRIVATPLTPLTKNTKKKTRAKKRSTAGVDNDTSSRSTVVTTNDEQMQMLKAAMRIHMEEQSKDMRSTAGENENEAKTKSSSSPPLNNGSLNRKPEASSLDAHVKKRAPSSTSVSSCKKRKVSPSKKQCANDKIISCKINGLTRSPSLVEVQQRTATLTSESACKMGSSSKKRSANENASSHMVEELIRSPSPVEAKQRSVSPNASNRRKVIAVWKEYIHCMSELNPSQKTEHVQCKGERPSIGRSDIKSEKQNGLPISNTVLSDDNKRKTTAVKKKVATPRAQRKSNSYPASKQPKRKGNTNEESSSIVSLKKVTTSETVAGKVVASTESFSKRRHEHFRKDDPSCNQNNPIHISGNRSRERVPKSKTSFEDAESEENYSIPAGRNSFAPLVGVSTAAIPSDDSLRIVRRETSCDSTKRIYSQQTWQNPLHFSHIPSSPLLSAQCPPLSSFEQTSTSYQRSSRQSPREVSPREVIIESYGLDYRDVCEQLRYFSQYINSPDILMEKLQKAYGKYWRDILMQCIMPVDSIRFDTSTVTLPCITHRLKHDAISPNWSNHSLVVTHFLDDATIQAFAAFLQEGNCSREAHVFTDSRGYRLGVPSLSSHSYPANCHYNGFLR